MKNNHPSNENAANPTVQTEEELSNQLKMIARGYTSVNNTEPSLYSYLHSYLITKEDFTDAHSQVNPDAISSISLDIEDEVKDAIENMFINSGYDRDYFYGFNYLDCNYVTGIALGNDEDEINMSNPVVFTAESTEQQDTVWAYFWNNGLDSLELHNENVDEYLVFVVRTEAECDKSTGRRSEEFMGCNNDGICEPMQGETPQNCTDCISPLPSHLKKLEVVEVTILEDKNRFDESYLATRYELGWDWLISDGIDREISYYRDNQLPNKFNNWKKKFVPRKRKNNTKGTAQAKNYKWRDGFMWDSYQPNIHDIYILFWEWDKYGKGIHTNAEDINGNPILPSYDWWTAALGNAGTFHKGGSFNQGGIIHIEASSANWTVDPSDPSRMIITATSPGLNEIQVKLAYK